MAAFKYITGPDGEEYVEVDFTTDMSTTGWKYSPWFYLPYDCHLAINGHSQSLSGTNQWELRGTVDPSNVSTFADPVGAQAYTASTFPNRVSMAFDPTTPNTPAGWYPYPYMRVGFNNGSTSNVNKTVIFTARFIKQG